MAQNFKKRRRPHGPSKNELRAARNENADLARSREDTLRQKFPNVSRLKLDIRLEGPSGIPLGEESKGIVLEKAVGVVIPCPSTCGGGQMNLTEALEESIRESKVTGEGLEICQAASYMDSRTPCGTKLYYRFTIEYQGETTS